MSNYERTNYGSSNRNDGEERHPLELDARKELYRRMAKEAQKAMEAQRTDGNPIPRWSTQNLPNEALEFQSGNRVLIEAKKSSSFKRYLAIVGGVILAALAGYVGAQFGKTQAPSVAIESDSTPTPSTEVTSTTLEEALSGGNEVVEIEEEWTEFP